MIIIIAVIIFGYIEAAIITGVYMYLVTWDKSPEPLNKDNETNSKQITRLSVAAGILFPVTLAILLAYALAERRKR